VGLEKQSITYPPEPLVLEQLMLASSAAKGRTLVSAKPVTLPQTITATQGKLRHGIGNVSHGDRERPPVF